MNYQGTVFWWKRKQPGVINENPVTGAEIGDRTIWVEWTEDSHEGGPYPARLDALREGPARLFTGTYSYPGSPRQDNEYHCQLAPHASQFGILLCGPWWNRNEDGDEGGWAILLFPENQGS
jgi:hypothetical protein